MDSFRVTDKEFMLADARKLPYRRKRQLHGLAKLFRAIFYNNLHEWYIIFAYSIEHRHSIVVQLVKYHMLPALIDQDITTNHLIRVSSGQLHRQPCKHRQSTCISNEAVLHILCNWMIMESLNKRDDKGLVTLYRHLDLVAICVADNHTINSHYMYG